MDGEMINYMTIIEMGNTMLYSNYTGISNIVIEISYFL